MSNIVTVTESDLGIDFDIGVQSPNKITIKDGIFAGEGAPPVTVGSNGQFWIDTLTSNIWGPVTNGTWPSNPSYYGNQGFVELSANQSVTLNNQNLNTFIILSPANTASNSIILPSPVNLPGVWIGFWNSSPSSFDVQASTNGIIGPAKFVVGGSQGSFTFQPDDLFYIVSDGHDWVIANYIAQEPVGGVASTTVLGVSREATSTEVASGITTGSTPAFVVPETLNATLSGFPLMLAGSGIPENTLGLNGWYYTDVTSGLFNGPKTNNTWPAALQAPITISSVFGTVAGTVY